MIIWLTNLPKNRYDQVLEVLNGTDKDSDGLTDAQWVADFNREVTISRMKRDRQLG